MSDMFCPVSLGDWLAVCDKAGMPAVPAEKVVEFEQHDVINFDVDGPHQERLTSAYQTVSRCVLDRHVLRWDCCASADVKYIMDRGGDGRWQDDLGGVPFPDDPRAFDIISEYPRFMLPMWRRPWVQAKVEEKHPVEYRAFVDHGKLLGISNYYPQRPLRHDEREVEIVSHYAATLTDALANREFEWERGYNPLLEIRDDDLGLQDRGCSFSADFLVRESDGAVLFLEGGPPHLPTYGAHPCCFRAGEIEGLALEDRNTDE